MDGWSAMFIGVGLFLWVFGFIKVGRKRETGFSIDKSFVRPPFFIYLICGMPKAQNIPRGIMSVSAVWSQLIGLLWVGYGIVYPFLQNQNLWLQGILLNIGIILIFAYGWFLYKRNIYKVE